MGWEDEATIAPPGGGAAPMREGSVEVAYAEASPTAAELAAPWRAIDICTRNTTYTLDARLRCTAVVERATGECQGDHVCVGAELMGGAQRSADGLLVAVAHPLPEVGMRAVFRGVRRDKPWFNETSPVVRVIIRQRVISFSSEGPPPSWDRITGRGTLPGY